MSIDITVPDIGDFDSVEIIELLVAAGDPVAADDPILVLESDKATMEVPTPVAGTIDKLLVGVGDKVAEGSVIAVLTPSESEGEAPAPDEPAPEPAEPAAAPIPSPQPQPPQPPPPAAPATGAKGLPHASPSVRKFARELGVDLTAVAGSGPKGRILKQDVQGFVKQALQGGATVGAGLPQPPAIDFSKFGEVELKELARIRKLSAQNLHRSWVLIPHVTQHDWADITELEAFRKAESERTGVKITLLPILMKALAHLLVNVYPEFNSSLDATGEHLVMKKYLHMGFAADTDNGLVVPVIRDVADKSITQLAREAAELAAKARDGKLAPADMQGSCFTVSSLGGIGGSHFTPIVNLPEVAILGVSRAQMQPVWNGNDFEPRLMLPLSLSYDHRVIDGAAAARFTTALASLLADLRRVLM